MGKASRRNRKKNPNQFKINQQNAKKKKGGNTNQRSKGHTLVRGQGQSKVGTNSSIDKLLHTHQMKVLHGEKRDGNFEIF